MSVAANALIVRNGLVFCTDTASLQTYKGPPLRNVLNQISPRGQGSTAYYIFSSGTEQVYIPTVGWMNSAYMDMYNNYSNSGNCCPSPYGYGDGLSVSGGTQYTYAILYKSVNRYTHPNFMYHYEFNGSGTYLTEYGVHLVGGYSGQETHLGDDWYWSRSLFTTNASAATINTGSWMYQYDTYNRFYVAKVMIVAGNYTSLHPRYWPDVNTTRSTAQSFIDLTKNSTITATGLTYDTAGAPSFSPTAYADLGRNVYSYGITRFATFAGWIKPTNAAAYGAYVLSDWNNLGMTLRINNATSTDFYVYPNNHRVTASYTFTDNVWYYLVGVMDGANMYTYVNGVQVGTTTLGEDIGNSPSTLKIASRGDGTGGCAQVTGHTTMYNRALSAAEIVQNFNATRGRYGV